MTGVWNRNREQLEEQKKEKVERKEFKIQNEIFFLFLIHKGEKFIISLIHKEKI